MEEKAKKKEIKNIHEGHRSRLRERFLKNGAASMEPHVMLELLLCYAIPRGDTNPIAHRLLDAFGSLSGVFDAPYEELLKVEGIGSSSALLLKMMPELFRKYQEDREKGGKRICCAEDALQLIRPKYIGRKTEAVTLLLLDSRGKSLYCGIVSEGAVKAAPIYANEMIRLAARYDAASAIIAHNHPSGRAIPTSSDISATRHVIWAFDAVDVELNDHLIITETDYLSMASAGMLEKLYEEYRETKSRRLHPQSQNGKSGEVADDEEIPLEEDWEGSQDVI